MTLLNEKNWKLSYRSSDDDLLNDFYIPALKSSVLYRRAAGYFSSKGLSIAARGIIKLLENNGRMDLVVSPHLNEADLHAIEHGYQKKGEIISDILLRRLDDAVSLFEKQRLEIISWMISENRLDIKIALPMQNGRISRGIYHEKSAIFIDKENNFLTFTGSPNESEDGYIYNFESFDVQRSWAIGEIAELAFKKNSDFDALWNNTTGNLQVINMPDAIKDKLLQIRPKQLPFKDPEEESLVNILGDNLIIPEQFLPLRNHQQIAVNSWLQNSYRGILEHATGSGKTVTALSTATKILETIQRLVLVIVCPQTYLVEQWDKEARKFGCIPILGYESSSRWINEFNSAVLDFNYKKRNLIVFITTNNTFVGDKAQLVISKISENLMIIADEVHNMGAKQIRKKLPQNAQYRLGLSATPDRWHDEEGTIALYDYFGDKLVPTYGIKQAIQDGHLCEYNYYPHIVELTDSENEEYFLITEKIKKAAIFSSSDIEDENNSGIELLLFKRARLIASAENKLKILKDLANSYRKTFYNIFYCGDGKIADERFLRKVGRILGVEFGIKLDYFTSEEDSTKRKKMISSFILKQIQALVAIKCLDEGVDIPNIERAFILASSTNPRQFIQRRGRVLRKTKDNPNKIAEIHDFLVIPTKITSAKYLDADTFNIERKLVRKELVRFSEFAETALNGPQASLKLLEIKKIYNLLDI